MKRIRTYTAKASEIKRKWFLVDAKGKTLGRIATRIANILMGKRKVNFTPHMDLGDFVVLVNAAEVAVSGKKETQKTYFSHSGYPGGDKLLNFAHLIKRQPERIIRQAVWGMLPQNRLGKAMLKKLKIFGGAKHDHLAQQPEILEI
jgi:large subunit ribosomal protein L13